MTAVDPLPDGFMARVAELRESEAVKRIAAEAPPLPQAAVDLLRAAGCPVGRRAERRAS